METPKRNRMFLALGAAALVGWAAAQIRAADAPAMPSEGAAPAPAASEAPAPATQPAAPAGDEKPAAPAAPAPPAPGRAIQVSGRVIHTWYERPDLRVMLIIDGFTVITHDEQLRASDGIVWFDEAEARKTGHATLGVYAETGVEVRRADGQVEKYDSVFLVMKNGAEVSLHSEVPLRGKAASAPLYLRAKKQRGEFLAGAGQEAPTDVVPAPKPEEPAPAPGVREAGVPQEITIVPQDDVRKVNFTSTVVKEKDAAGNERDVRVSIWTGGIYVMRGDMEMAADNLVIWTPEEKGGPPGGAEAPPSLLGPTKRQAAEAYFEGNVQVNQGRRTIWCSQMYYDFQRNQALALDSRIRTFTKARNVPVLYWAKEVRQLAENLFQGTDAWMTTCEFAHPHYEMGASEMALTDLTDVPEAAEEKPGGEPEPDYRRIRFAGKDVQARVRHLPISYWPRMAGDLEESETALRSIRIETRSNFGTGFLSQWHLMKLLGLGTPPRGFHPYFNLDFWSKRGPAAGVEMKYQREDFFGDFRSYLLHDIGKDSIGSEDVNPEKEDRGRVLWRHRHYLPQNWEMTMELSYISDPAFLNEFFEVEDEQEKSQETLLYLKKQEREQALTILAAWRLNDFYTRTEYLPQVGYNVIGHSLLDDKLTYFQDSEVAWARYRPAETDLTWAERLQASQNNIFRTPWGARESGTAIADTIHELDVPLKAGPVGITPFAEGRITYFEEVLDRSGPDWRTYGRAGTRAAAEAWRVYDNVDSDFWDLHRIRHINTFDVTAYAASSSIASRDLIPFDVQEAGTPTVQGVDDTGVVELGWRQRLQTKRGTGDRRTTVDWLIADLRFTFYSDTGSPMAVAPDGRRAHNHVDLRADMLVTDSASLWTDTQFNTNDGTLDLFSVGTTITHTPRISYSIGHRIIPDASSAMTFFSMDYRINDKWSLRLLEQYEWDQKQNAQSNFILTRRMHCWLMRLRVELDPGEDDKFIGIEFQPVGTPEIRFSAL